MREYIEDILALIAVGLFAYVVFLIGVGLGAQKMSELETKLEILEIFKEQAAWRELPPQGKKLIQNSLLAMSLEKFSVLCELARTTKQ